MVLFGRTSKAGAVMVLAGVAVGAIAAPSAAVAATMIGSLWLMGTLWQGLGYDTQMADTRMPLPYFDARARRLGGNILKAASYTI